MASHPGIALALFLASQRPGGRSRAERRLQRELAAGREDADRGSERLGATSLPRPPGPLVWLHVGSEAEALGIPELIDRLREERDDLGVLITTARHGPDELLAARLPRDVALQFSPYGTGPGVDTFLQHWRPDLAVWADNRLEPALIEAAGRAGIEMFLVDARVPERPGWRWFPGLRRALLKRFSHVLAGDERAAAGLRALGVAEDRIEAMGFLQEGTAPLPCSQAERDTIAEILAARPVWLAAGATAGEVQMVVEAHRQAMRGAHRLLLVLVPDPLEDGPALAAALEADGWVVGLRSGDDEPEPEVEIFVADLGDELGLWYRLSPISLMGGTLMGEQGARNPFEAAALGSAVLFGPHLGLWRESYERLRDAGAARAVADTASLARAVEFLLSPDKVAEMAAAAWEVTTSGAEATDRIVALVIEALDKRGV
ncbi:3-deoxy-D-manno-octulosonic acid transferase [Sinisalibacter aestuarii]|uniref:3-deoxy-D-manno-octulosonic acid transferase n=1 Tax=Sinisalibacter aestuarii TaxID=2949426 RepID=A0ABQ5LMS9_9RHOB|nr:glycosyltransferase N-terminal domain-containing protein [Sinisalibacter aestuarii]GKY86324.1 3-deoxy-D-manno-octulosonic acid transferase [Sinisalibacter aestuarii]